MAWLATGSNGLLVLALLVGAGAGVGAIAFRELIVGATRLFSGHADYSAAGHAANPLVPGLGIWFVVLAPVVGGLLYGPLVAWLAPEARGHGVPEVMLAVGRHGGRIRPRVPFVKALASALCIGAGGSVGREGPIVQIASALGSTAGQLARVSEARLRLLVAAGAAGGIAATFNAPIAGVFFALEVILRDFEVQSFGVVVVAAVTANAIGRLAFGSAAFLTLPAFGTPVPAEYAFAVVLGALAAVVGIAFIRTLYGSEDFADRIWRGPEWLRPAVGGLLLGGLLLALPQMYGVGYPVLEHAVGGRYVLGLLALLLVGKLVATSLTLAIGGSGGVFAPSLFAGAMLGSAFGLGVHALAGGPPAGVYGLLGMGAVFAATARAPITAVLIIFELTGEYAVIAPLMIAVVVATGLANRITRETIYTLKLRRRGIALDRPRGDLMGEITVGEAMRAIPAPLAHDTPVEQVLARLARGRHGALPVLDENGALVGVATAPELEHALADGATVACAADVAHAVPELRAGEPLERAVRALGRAGEEGLPVLADGDGTVAGWVTHRDVLDIYRRRLDGEAQPIPAVSEIGAERVAHIAQEPETERGLAERTATGASRAPTL